MLSAVLIFATFAVIILVACISNSQPSLLIAVFGLANGIPSGNTPTERNLSAAPIITTTKNSTLSILSTIPLGYGEPESIAVNPKTNTMYLVTIHYDTPSTLNYTTYKNNIVTVIDGKTNKVTGTITVRDGYKGIAIHQLNVDAKANKVYATGDYIVRGEHLKDCYQPLLSPTNAINSLTNATTTAASTKIDCSYDVVYVIDGNTKRLIDKVLLFGDTDGQKEGGVYEIASNTNTSTVYADSYYDSGGYTVLYAIDRSNPKNTRTSEIPVDGNGPEGVTVNPKTNRVYSLYTDDNGTTNFVAVIDGQTNKIIKNITLPKPAGTESYSKGVAINPQTNRLYVDDGGPAGLVVVDTSTNHIIESLKEISGPNSISVNSNANRVYAINSDYNGNNHPISNKTTSKLFAIDGNSNKILSILHLNTILKNIAVNPSTNLIYLLGWNCNNACDYKDAGKSVLFVVKPPI
jgi:DNA-binding beta-propeller fold protein YncE